MKGYNLQQMFIHWNMAYGMFGLCCKAILFHASSRVMEHKFKGNEICQNLCISYIKSTPWPTHNTSYDRKGSVSLLLVSLIFLKISVFWAAKLVYGNKLFIYSSSKSYNFPNDVIVAWSLCPLFIYKLNCFNAQNVLKL